VHLDPSKEPFEAWTHKIQLMNTTLRNTTAHLSDDTSCKQLKSLLDKELLLMVKKANIPAETKLREWILAIKELDVEHQLTNQQHDKHIAGTRQH